ncbi:radical SAM family heme chaperone HemW [Azohydromonas sp.]|mgnify:CR=1 FL=1|uniref:radical SAM family heme chaperone HemW n=1 Tax=Azohydromonas sp. TaxID=1872666 RepID=UPI002C918AA9|nr:radical SAM family heme chaperone HemW [Azohydromonas sp.]HMM85859.1 radical SAM family heme chaperone HemW [Azohydromonas sp.]
MADPRRGGDGAAAPVRVVRAGDTTLASLPPLSLYVHLPWCLRKCPYCDFNSHELPTTPGPAALDPGLERDYVDALVTDLEASLPQVWGRRVVSVFLGGGTPSLFGPAAIDRLLAAVRARLPLEPGGEVTLEANPGTFERERFRAYRDAGVTRLSLGVQSFDDALLARIGRVHDARQALAAAEEAARCFDTFNLDLMYALPGQDGAMLEHDLRQALAFAPPHLSVYHLTIEPNTRFATRPPAGLPDDDTAAAMLDAIVEHTAGAGLERYEVSAFARPGHRCVHNLNYWRFGDYLGIGAGAHGKLSFPDRIVRQVRWRDPATYLQRVREGRAVSNEHRVGVDELPFEFVLNALRLREGFAPSLFAERTGLSPSVLDDAVSRALARGLVERGADARVRPTPRGFDFLSDLQALFLPAR